MENKTVIISGIGGMDGAYLARFLLQNNYRVIGILRRSSNNNAERLRTIKGSPNLHLVYGDVTDPASMNLLINNFQPDEFYHLAANSFVATSWNSPSHYIETNTIGTINCLEALRQYKKDCKFYFAGSSEMYGDYVKRVGGHVMLDENSPMVAASPYGVSKVAGYQMTKVYRESYNMFATCGILFNHSAPLRGEEFFTRKVSSQLAKVKWGLQDFIELGNLSSSRDEGASQDYIRAMHAMLQHDRPDDFVIATGQTHTCQEWVEKCLSHFGLSNNIIKINKNFFRLNEVNVLIGDASKARNLLGWQPECSFDQLVQRMCQYDFHLQSPNPDIYRKADEFIS
jgi:GDPmannose 4,6-dehydratase